MHQPIALITGGSRGIGAATALLAAQHGYAVVVNYTSNSLAADEVVRQIRATGGTAITVQADVAVESQVMAMFDKIDAKLGPLTCLVNNAGVVDVACRVDAMDVARLQRMFAPNVISAFACAREAVKRMSTRHGGTGGSIVNVSSAASRLGGSGQYVDYAASKGAIDTDIHASGGQPERARQLAPQVPMQRAGTALEVAQAIVWLMGDASSYSSGALIDVAGGR